MEVPTPWTELMDRPEREVPLDEAALVIAAHVDPTTDVDAQLHRLDTIAADMGRADTDAVCSVLFSSMGLRGDTRTYDDPSNSCLDKVLDRRLGIPISLSVLLIEIGRRCGLHLSGVGMPGHFLVRDGRAPELLIDPFGGGRRLDPLACAVLLRTVAGPDAVLTPEMTADTSTWAILARMLANLDGSYRRRRDLAALQWVTRLRAQVPGLPLHFRLELADSLVELGCHADAAGALELAAGSPTMNPESARSLRARAVSLRARLN